mmetsp:Transcript_22211/g.59939  ORF Transcript_22211/g.59939 Transcript_22211/m.59939 type:complete len:207 (+) Transcript_22211:1298-1918(+)
MAGQVLHQPGRHSRLVTLPPRLPRWLQLPPPPLRRHLLHEAMVHHGGVRLFGDGWSLGANRPAAPRTLRPQRLPRRARSRRAPSRHCGLATKHAGSAAPALANGACSGHQRQGLAGRACRSGGGRCGLGYDDLGAAHRRAGRAPGHVLRRGGPAAAALGSRGELRHSGHVQPSPEGHPQGCSTDARGGAGAMGSHSLELAGKGQAA